jgi:hypothetical protein
VVRGCRCARADPGTGRGSPAAGLCGDRIIRAVRARGRSCVDAHPRSSAGSVRLHVFHYFGRVSYGLGDWERDRIVAGEDSRAPAPGAGLVPTAGGTGNRLDSVQSGSLAALLARKSLDRLRRLVQLPARSRTRVLGPLAASAVVGRELSSRARGRRAANTGFRPSDGTHLRRGHSRSHRGRARREPPADSVDRIERRGTKSAWLLYCSAAL